MRIHIVHAHPESASFTSGMKDLAVSVLSEQGHAVSVSNLYDMNWNPVASAADFGSRKNCDYLVYALEQRHNWANETISPDIQAEVEKLMASDVLILSFPLYWFSTPAIMKGWIDRVLLSGLCYGGTRFYDQGGLLGKKALVACTLGGREHMFGSNAIHGEIDIMLAPLLRGTLAYTGMDVLTPFLAYHIPYLDSKERGRILEDYRLRLLSLANETPLPMPSLNDYDDQMRPRRR